MSEEYSIGTFMTCPTNASKLPTEGETVMLLSQDCQSKARKFICSQARPLEQSL